MRNSGVTRELPLFKEGGQLKMLTGRGNKGLVASHRAKLGGCGESERQPPALNEYYPASPIIDAPTNVTFKRLFLCGRLTMRR
jgi:hypothetical protein